MVRKRSAKTGFSLIELLVVLVIISIFSALLGPRVGGTLVNMGLLTATKKVAASLRYARSRAITESMPYVAMLDLSENRLTIGPEEKAGEGDAKPDPEEIKPDKKRYVLPSGVRFKDAVKFDGSASDSRFFAVVFMPSGCSSGGTLYLENRRKRECRIHIDFVTGTVRVETS